MALYDIGAYEFIPETIPPVVEDVLTRNSWQAEIKFYIKNDAGTYVDFSERFGNDRFFSCSEVRHITEGQYGQPVTKTVKVTVDNSDRYWDADPPAGFTTFYGKDAQLRMKLADATSEVNLCTMRIAPDGIETNDTERATIELEPLTEWFSRIDASSFKKGLQKYEFRSWLFLVRELIRSEFGDATTGAMPSGYVFPSDPRITFPDGARHFSVWGKPPQFDGSSWNDDNTDIPYDLDGDDTTLWVCIGPDLWEYTIATDTWTNRGEDAAQGTGVNARYVRDGGDYILVLKWTTDSDMIQTDLSFTLWDVINEEWNTTSRGTVTNFFAGWHYFNGEAVSAARYKGDASSNDIGTNLIVPFPQDLVGDSGTMTSYIRGGIHDATGSDTQDDVTFPAGWYRLYNATGTAFGVAVHWGNRQNIEAKLTSDGVLVYYSSWSTVNGKGMISKMAYDYGDSIGSPQDVLANADIPTGSLFFCPRLEFDNTDDLYYIRFDESVTADNEDTTSFRKSVVSGALPASQTEYFTNGTAALCSDNYSYIIDIIWANPDDDNGTAVIVVLEVDRVNLWPTYRIVKSYNHSTTVAFADVEHSSVCPRVAKSRSNDYPWWVNQETGSVCRCAAGGTSVTRMDGGAPPVFDAPYCANFIVVGSDETAANIYGISWPFHEPETQEIRTEGKYYLWQFATTHTGRVEIADFADLNKLEAVSQLCSAFSHAVYVDPDGNWTVKQRDSTTTPTTSIVKQFQGTEGWLRLGKKKATDIENYIEVVPSEPVLSPMKTTIVQKATSTYNGTITATQLDRLERRVKLRCMTGGKVSTGKTRFDYLVYNSMVETRLGAAYSSGTDVTLESVDDVAVGDEIEVLNSGLKTITAVTAATKVVTIASDFATAYPILSQVAVTKTNNAKWSSLGVTLLAEALDSSETGVDVDDATQIAVGNYIIVGAEEMLVTAKTGNTLTVTRGDNAASHADNSTVGVVVKPGGLGKMIEIGGQNIQIMFERDGDAAEQPIAFGDYIEFVCPGMSIDNSAGSKVIVSDKTSIGTYGRRKNKGTTDNRFLTRTLAECALSTRVARYKDPNRTVEITMGLDLQHGLYDPVYLQSYEVFPSESAYTVAMIVREVGYRPMTNETTYVLEEQ